MTLEGKKEGDDITLTGSIVANGTPVQTLPPACWPDDIQKADLTGPEGQRATISVDGTGVTWALAEWWEGSKLRLRYADEETAFPVDMKWPAKTIPRS